MKKLVKFFKVFYYLVLAVIFILAADVLRYFIFPDVTQLKTKTPEKSAFMEWREKRYQDAGKNVKIKSKYVPISRISPYVLKAVLIAEDDKFYDHDGFDFEAIQKAIEIDLEKGAFKYGASTITQQLAKNLYLSPSKNPVRKIKEAILTFRMEESLSKKRILELYLNFAEWGEGIFGVEAAANKYFRKSAAALSPEEAARLAAVLPSPLKLNPAGGQKYVQNRARKILFIMERRGNVIFEQKGDEPAPSPPQENKAGMEDKDRDVKKSGPQAVEPAGRKDSPGKDGDKDEVSPEQAVQVPEQAEAEKMK